MTEIEKMYENAGIKPQYKKRTECKDGYTVGHPCEKGIACINCNRSVFEDVMPPFTAEKQLELIKWLMVNNKDYQYDIEDNKYWFIIDDYRETKYREFDEALAELINLYWQDLTDQEKEEIRNILNA